MHPEGTVIYEYEDEESFPVSHLSVFLEVRDDARYSESLTVTCVSSKYRWFCDDLVIYETDGVNYAGATSIFMPENMPFTSGEYEVIYRSLSDETDKGYFYVSSYSALAEIKASEVEEFMKERNGKKKIAVYDSEDKLIYFGLYSDVPDPFYSFSNAQSYRVVWTVSNSVMCLLPLQEKWYNKAIWTL